MMLRNERLGGMCRRVYSIAGMFYERGVVIAIIVASSGISWFFVVVVIIIGAIS